MSLASTLKVMALALADLVGSALGLAPIIVPLIGPPGSAALMTTPDAEPGYLSLVPPDAPWANRIAARFALAVLGHHPGRSIEGIRAPVLFCVCDSDSVAPAEATLRHAAKAARGEVKRYDLGHFDIYRGEAFESTIADQIDFLRRHVPAG